jgi:E3 ubiquitin-protein ligase HERC2
LIGAPESLRPILVEGFGEVRVSRVCAGLNSSSAIGEDGELFSWGDGGERLGHGDTHDRPSPERVEALRGVRVSSVSVGIYHALALAEDGLVYGWSELGATCAVGDPDAESWLLPKPIEALRGVRVCSVAAAGFRSYAVADTGELWTWGIGDGCFTPLGHDEQDHCLLPKPIESLRGVKVVAVSASESHALALAGDGDVYAWGGAGLAGAGVLGQGLDSVGPVRTPQRVPALRVASGFRVRRR